MLRTGLAVMGNTNSMKSRGNRAKEVCKQAWARLTARMLVIKERFALDPITDPPLDDFCVWILPRLCSRLDYILQA